MEPREMICRECRFWITANAPGGVGRCRRNAPVPYIAGLVNPESIYQGTQLEGAAIWPRTRDVDWCGEHITEYRGDR